MSTATTIPQPFHAAYQAVQVGNNPNLAKLVEGLRPGCVAGRMFRSQAGTWMVVPASLAALFQAPTPKVKALALPQVKRDPDWLDADCPNCSLRFGSRARPAPLGEKTCGACKTNFEIVA